MNSILNLVPKWFDATHIVISGALVGGFTWFEIHGFIPPASTIFGLTLLVVMDTVTGIISAKKQGKHINSKAFSGVITKLAIYFVLISAVYITASAVPDSEAKEWLLSVPLTAIFMRELWSITENVNVIKPELIPRGLRDKLRKYNKKSDE